MTSARRLLLTALPKVLLSRLTGVATRVPLPRALRGPAYRGFARRYGAALDEMLGQPSDFRSLWHFFQRPLRAGARPLAAAPLLWPCDGRIVTAGGIERGRIPQVKGNDYALADLLGCDQLAQQLDGGSQVTIYLAPGDYHRVHAPFAATVQSVRALPGTLFPVNPMAVRCIDGLFVRNARHVFACQLTDGRAAAVVMVGALNVGDTSVSIAPPCDVSAGQELGRFGFGSTAVALVAAGGPQFRTMPAESVVRMGAAATAAAAGS